MDPASSFASVQEKAELHRQNLVGILNDPRKTLYFMVGSALVIALLVIIYLTISNFFASREGANQLQANPVVEESAEKTDLDPQRRRNIDTINAAIVSYHRKNKAYPQALSNLVPSFLASVPSDPKNGRSYSYRVSLDLKSYQLWAVLENGQEYLRSGP